MTDIAIRFDGAGKTYPDGTTAVEALDLEIPRGSLTVFVGPSGCGKTTSLRMINRMVEPTSGTVTVEGRDVASVPAHELRRSMGYVMQQSGLLPHRTVVDNVATVPRLNGVPKRQARERARELLATVGLDASLAGRYPAQLSGGQQQRVGVARALAADPPLLLMDEPFSAVDPVVRQDLQRELLDLQRRLHRTIVFVTHDIDEAILLGNRVAVFAAGGRLAQYATPEELLRSPADDFVADFVGRDRGFRSLTFDSAHDIPLRPVGTVRPDGSPGVVGPGDGPLPGGWSLRVDDDGAPRGWVRTGAEDDPVVGGTLHRPGGSLRSALDAALSSPSGLAVVVDEAGRAVGVMDPADIVAAVEDARLGGRARR
ncbi:ATP-binding cassette domain-containing protein [Kocuria sp.]|uniref:ABC transporter ATP-binding protein n=1 Tax=Kocuria sp. TaxID=1871328 RepID=UPI00281170CA|nr:ATP-binding cassette domain-containing protein [Kocuria sp.]